MISYRILNRTILIVTFFSLFIAFSPTPKNDSIEFYFSKEILNYNFDVIKVVAPDPNTKLPFLENSYVAFKEALAFKESRGRYNAVNTFGYLGKFQFGSSTLKTLGIYNLNLFLNSPELQEKAFLANTKRNKWKLTLEINRFTGSEINGVIVTESGILASAHLAGPGNVKRYLKSYGSKDFKDAYGT
ncbi:peptidoglycan-binding protein LysM, partial [Flavobacteriaceae bacterium]|nr:peptidoglycan-binding protein LysM [Flavobacteriaceae bacterium]